MKTYLHAFAMCQSMFCAIPFPCKVWDEEARSKMLLCLPIVGLEMGAIWWGLAWVARFFSLPPLVKGLLLAVYPFLVTGLIHLDGFMDVTDAVKSCRDLPRRREILKDSHVGSFAVIHVALLILAQFTLFASLPEEAPLGVLCLIPGVSRCGSALAVTALPAMSTSQYAGQKRNRGQIWLLGGMLGMLLLTGVCLWGKYGLVPMGVLAGSGFALRRGYRSLEGMNGDIAGYALTLGELCGAAVYALI